MSVDVCLSTESRRGAMSPPALAPHQHSLTSSSASMRQCVRFGLLHVSQSYVAHAEWRIPRTTSMCGLHLLYILALVMHAVSLADRTLSNSGSAHLHMVGSQLTEFKV